jgi:hypothetical protein
MIGSCTYSHSKHYMNAGCLERLITRSIKCFSLDAVGLTHKGKESKMQVNMQVEHVSFDPTNPTVRFDTE